MYCTVEYLIIYLIILSDTSHRCHTVSYRRFTTRARSTEPPPSQTYATNHPKVYELELSLSDK